MNEHADTGTQAVPFENPMGVDGFEFVEFAAPDPSLLHKLFPRLGFAPVARHRRMQVTLYRQGDCNFLVNEEPGSLAMEFAAQHGPCASGFAIRFSKPAQEVRQWALAHGGEAIGTKEDIKSVSTPTIKGIGGCMLYLVDRYGERGEVYADDFEYLPGVDRHPQGFGIKYIDHLTHNLYFGNMEKWSEYYEKLFNFRQIRYFDIKGAKTGLVSKAMTAPDGMVRIPLNQSSEPKSQINEYLDEYRGEGIQHVACFTNDIYATVEAMHAQQIQFLDTPDTYYEVVDERIPGHSEKLESMRKNGILIDADTETHQRLLLQIFTQNCIGPIFFEIIQRKGNEGFGEGNFQALFESIERDQIRRGVL